MVSHPPIYAARTHDKMCHLDEEQGCDEYSDDDVAEYFMIELRAIANESAPYCEQGEWCTECYRELLSLVSQYGYLGGSDPE